MPRRISDYPDAFAGWNLISSIGSIVSVIATWLFLDILYKQLVEGKSVSRYPWSTPQFFTDYLQHFLNRTYNSLEWALNSPPKPHAFASLPLQSKITFKDILLILVGIFTLSLPFKTFFILLGISCWIFLYCSIQHCVLLAVSLLWKEKDLPSLLQFFIIFISMAIFYWIVHYLVILFVPMVFGSGCLILYLDNPQPSSLIDYTSKLTSFTNRIENKVDTLQRVYLNFDNQWEAAKANPLDSSLRNKAISTRQLLSTHVDELDGMLHERERCLRDGCAAFPDRNLSHYSRDTRGTASKMKVAREYVNLPNYDL
jgi:hypothetical protein